MFFIISGFVILMTLSRTETWKDFVVSRASRIYPAYWAAVLLTFGVVSLASLPGREATLPEALVNLTMLQDWLGAPRVDGVHWTLSVELSFYALMLAAFGVGLIKRPLLIGLIWLSVLPLALLLFLLSFELPARFLLFILAVRYAHLFIAGMMFYELYLGRRARPRYLLLAYCLIAHAVWNGVGASFLVVSVAYAVIWLVVHGRLTVAPARWSCWGPSPTPCTSFTRTSATSRCASSKATSALIRTSASCSRSGLSCCSRRPSPSRWSGLRRPRSEGHIERGGLRTDYVARLGPGWAGSAARLHLSTLARPTLAAANGPPDDGAHPSGYTTAAARIHQGVLAHSPPAGGACVVHGGPAVRVSPRGRG